MPINMYKIDVTYMSKYTRDVLAPLCRGVSAGPRAPTRGPVHSCTKVVVSQRLVSGSSLSPSPTSAGTPVGQLEEGRMAPELYSVM